MSAISINQLAVPVTPADIQTLRVHPRTGRINMLFLSEGERKNDGTMNTGVDLNFALLESDTGDADDWNLISKVGTAKTATAAASDTSSDNVLLTLNSNTDIVAGDYVAVTGADKDRLNGVFEVISGSGSEGMGTTSIIIGTPWVSAAAAATASQSTVGLTTAVVTEVAPITVVPGGSESANVLTHKTFLKAVGWGTDGSGYARMDLQFNGLFGFGQVDIEVNATKSGFGFIGNGAPGVGGLGRATTWPEVP